MTRLILAGAPVLAAVISAAFAEPPPLPAKCQRAIELVEHLASDILADDMTTEQANQAEAEGRACMVDTFEAMQAAASDSNARADAEDLMNSVVARLEVAYGRVLDACLTRCGGECQPTDIPEVCIQMAESFAESEN